MEIGVEKNAKCEVKGQGKGSAWKEREWGPGWHSLAFHEGGQVLGHC